MAPPAKPARPPAVIAHRENGLDMLLGRDRISRAQAQAGRDYGVLERTAQISGAGSIRSFLEERVGGAGSGGGLPPGDLEGAAWIADCRVRLTRAQAALGWHPEKLALLSLICGRGMHPREISQVQRETEQLEAILRIALDDLITHFRAGSREKPLAPFS